MTLTDTEELNYRVDQELYETCRYDVVRQSDQWDSVADLTRAAIKAEITDLHGTAKGGRVARKLVRRVDDIREIQEEAPEASAEARIEGSDSMRSLTAAIPKEHAGMLKDLTDETELSPSEAARYCLFKYLSEEIDKDELLQEWQDRKITKTWVNLRNSLVEPKIGLHQVLTRRFRLLKKTPYFIRDDPQAFRDFAEVYKADFYETDLYDQLQGVYDDRTFSTVESMIEEYTDIVLDADSDLPDDFLEDMRDINEDW
ncbi:hypothetical protein GCM10028857_13290 [Salinarchaeum chitinilyticum]